MNKLIKIKSLCLSLSLLFSVITPLAMAQGSLTIKADATLQDAAATRQVAEQFLRAQAASLPGEISVTIGALDPRLQLPACAAAEAFMPPGSRLWGKTNVGVRCRMPQPWTVYMSATVRAMGEYLVTSKALSQGKIIDQNDITKMSGDLASLPAGTLTDPAQALGRIIAISLSSGIPLRQDAIRVQQAVQQGQTVRLVSSGQGFSISAEAKAMTAGVEGQMVQTKTPSGQIISGIAKLGGVVEVAY